MNVNQKLLLSIASTIRINIFLSWNFNLSDSLSVFVCVRLCRRVFIVQAFYLIFMINSFSKEIVNGERNEYWLFQSSINGIYN